MRRKIAGLTAVLFLAVAGYVFAHEGGGMMGGQGGGMMGMMRMMNECGGMMEASPVSAEPVTKERAEAIVKQNLANLRNPNLKTGKVVEETAGFVVEITTKDGALVDKIIVDKRTGHARSAY